MRNQHTPVLIFAQSGRFIAQSATQAGYRVWVADCFGDQDSLAVSERWQKIAPIHQLSKQQILDTFSTLSQGEECLLICGSGIEKHYSILNNLPANITLIGNSVKTIHTIQTPTLFFNLLRQLELSYPDTRFKQPNDGEWLTKTSSSFGGTSIQYLKAHQQIGGDYYQHCIKGESGSALFIANGEHAQLLSVNQQYLQPCASSPFRLGGITSPWPLSEQHQHHLKLVINKISSSTGLKGLNSIDFIISESNTLFILEINPRISASAELLDCSDTLFKHHINACNGLLPEQSIVTVTSPSRLHYFYAQNEISISPKMVWPSSCHDIPSAGTSINKDDPICTLKIQALTTDLLQQDFCKLEKELTLQLLLD